MEECDEEEQRTDVVSFQCCKSTLFVLCPCTLLHDLRAPPFLAPLPRRPPPGA